MVINLYFQASKMWCHLFLSLVSNLYLVPHNQHHTRNLGSFLNLHNTLCIPEQSNLVNFETMYQSNSLLDNKCNMGIFWSHQPCILLLISTRRESWAAKVLPSGLSSQTQIQWYPSVRCFQTFPRSSKWCPQKEYHRSWILRNHKSKNSFVWDLGNCWHRELLSGL